MSEIIEISIELPRFQLPVKLAEFLSLLSLRSTQVMKQA
jgi:hypothetical protein